MKKILEKDTVNLVPFINEIKETMTISFNIGDKTYIAGLTDSNKDKIYKLLKSQTNKDGLLLCIKQEFV
jgi:hypothetical protein